MSTSGKIQQSHILRALQRGLCLLTSGFLLLPSLAFAQTNVIPPSSNERARPSSETSSNTIPEWASTGLEAGSKTLEKSAKPYLRRGEQITQDIADAPWSATPYVKLDMQTPIGGSLKKVGNGFGYIGNAVDLYSIGQTARDVAEASKRGNMREVDSKMGDITATAICLHPAASGLCFLGGVSDLVTGVDPVKWALKAYGSDLSHKSRMGCGGTGSVIGDQMMEMSDTCIENRMREWEENVQQRRASQQVEMDRIVASNAAEVQAKQEAMDAYRASISTPIEPTGPHYCPVKWPSPRQRASIGAA